MIRFITKNDINEVYRLMCILENKTLNYQIFKEIYEQQINCSNHIGIVAELDGKLVAFLNLRFEAQLHHCEKICEIMELIVDDQYRSLGIGKSMFSKAIEIAKENNCPQIELATNQLRKRAHHFYEREGMSNFHYKYSMRLDGNSFKDNKIGN